MKDIAFYIIQFEEVNHYEKNINPFEGLYRTIEETKKRYKELKKQGYINIHVFETAKEN